MYRFLNEIIYFQGKIKMWSFFREGVFLYRWSLKQVWLYKQIFLIAWTHLHDISGKAGRIFKIQTNNVIILN